MIGGRIFDQRWFLDRLRLLLLSQKVHCMEFKINTYYLLKSIKPFNLFCIPTYSLWSTPQNCHGWLLLIDLLVVLHCQPKVSHLRLEMIVEEDIPCCQVSVNQIVALKIAHTFVQKCFSNVRRSRKLNVPFRMSEHQLTRLLKDGTLLSFSDFLDLLWRQLMC